MERTKARQIGGRPIDAPRGGFSGGNHSGTFRVARAGAEANIDRSNQGMKDGAYIVL
ncbi:MAG: hypothetical protein ABSD38_31700 [Syntrophorhabdales bacterium]